MNTDTTAANRLLARRVVLASAAYDLVMTAGFATPWTARIALDGIAGLHDRLGLSGTVPDAGDPFTMLFANLLGSIVVVWSVVRLLRPTPFLGAADTVGRLLFSLWFGYALGAGASTILIGFLVLEIGWGVVQGAAVSRPLRATMRAGRRTLAAC